jgi:hypothetical protein
MITDFKIFEGRFKPESIDRKYYVWKHKPFWKMTQTFPSGAGNKDEEQFGLIRIENVDVKENRVYFYPMNTYNVMSGWNALIL